MSEPTILDINEAFKQLKLYHDKVYAKPYQPLDQGEIKEIEEIRARLDGSDTKDPQISELNRYILNILDMNNVILMAKEEEKLEKELRELGLELRINKTLTAEQKTGIEQRRQTIRETLYPEHCPPSSHI